MSRVGDKIRAAREKSGFTQKNFAKKLGVAEKYINELESGRKVANESFIQRASKLLKTDLNDISMVVTDEELVKERKAFESMPKKKSKESAEVWTDAFASVLKNVPIYDYSLKQTYGTKEMAVHSNKVEGYPQDKVLYLKVQDDEMNGFRMLKGDIAFGHKIKELTNNGFFLVEYKGERKIRQVKTLGNSKILLVSNAGSLRTETMEIKSVIPIAKIEKVEIKL